VRVRVRAGVRVRVRVRVRARARVRAGVWARVRVTGEEGAKARGAGAELVQPGEERLHLDDDLERLRLETEDQRRLLYDGRARETLGPCQPGTRRCQASELF